MESIWKKVEIRWSDLDANRHLANSAYMNFTSNARIATLKEAQISMQTLAQYGIGPAILLEQYSFYREALHGNALWLETKIAGMSKDGSLYKFHQDFYNAKGEHLAHAYVFGVWMDLKARKMTALPEDLLQKMESIIDWNTIEILEKADLKKLPNQPQNINKDAIPC